MKLLFFEIDNWIVSGYKVRKKGVIIASIQDIVFEENLVRAMEVIRKGIAFVKGKHS